MRNGAIPNVKFPRWMRRAVSIHINPELQCLACFANTVGSLTERQPGQML